MLGKSVEDALNEQVKNEFYAAFTYLSMSAYFNGANLDGFANWMRIQSQEEMGHAMKIFNFILDRGGRVHLRAIEEPPSTFKSPLDAFEKALEHEQRVTQMINRLLELAVKENDYPTQGMLQWFITEQVEEEKSASMAVEQLKMVGEDNAGLLMLNMKMGERKPE
jgi:ferritin